MLLGNIIKQYRSEHKMSMQTFADLIHSSKSYVSMIEKNYNPATGKPINPSLETLKLISDAIHIDIDTLLKMLDDNQEIILDEKKYKEQFKKRIKGVKVPVLGYIKAGIPISAIEEIIDYEEIPETLARKGQFFALTVKGDSMAPDIKEGDIAILLVQSNVENGEIGAIIFNGDNEATLKRIYKDETGITLIPDNPNNQDGFKPTHYTNKEIEEIPITIAGKLMEIRKKYY